MATEVSANLEITLPRSEHDLLIRILSEAAISWGDEQVLLLAQLFRDADEVRLIVEDEVRVVGQVDR